MYKVKFISTLILLLMWQLGISQKTPAVNAIPMADSLVFSSAAAVSNTTITYNWSAKKYYSIRAGNINFPLETWNETGGLSVYQDTAGLDSRGIWWNPNLNQLERNCFNSIGWSTIQLNGSNNATKNFTMLFTGLNQPNGQSCGAYDFKTNTVLFCFGGQMYVYDRNTALLSGIIPLTGISFTTVNQVAIMYTGQIGYEIALLDYAAKRIYLFDRVTGALTGVTQLPASAVTSATYRVGYTNQRLWLFNSSVKTWNSYYIWNEPLPVELVHFNAKTSESKLVKCEWTTASEVNNDFFEVQRSADGQNFETIGLVDGTGSTSSYSNYNFIDAMPLQGLNYYRLRQNDFDGNFEYSEIVKVEVASETYSVYPNPVKEKYYLKLDEADKSGMQVIQLHNALGEIVFSRRVGESEKSVELDRAGFPAGSYFLSVLQDGVKRYCVRISFE